MGLFTHVNVSVDSRVHYSSTFAEKVELAGDLLMSPLYVAGWGNTKTIKVKMVVDSKEGTTLSPDDVTIRRRSLQIISGIFSTLLSLPFVALGCALKASSFLSSHVREKHAFATNPSAESQKQKLAALLTARLPIDTRLNGKQGEEVYGLELCCGMGVEGCKYACGV